MMCSPTSVLPRPFRHSGPPCVQHKFFFDVVTQMIDVFSNSAQTTPTHYALNISWGEPGLLTLVNDVSLIQTFCLQMTHVYIVE